ncbi:MAG: MFS transporter [Eikenella corrodens]|uniref:MFS transporter n=1 Tax=Eikenella corrodens TaxID=539 RepID=UPI00290A8A33|nr:MFS transporter [Eikenella corrodens]MDU4300227.1 MFS transporter [Eikenella corrodens]
MAHDSSRPNRRDWLLLATAGTYKFTLIGFYLVALMTILKNGGFNLKQLGWIYLIGSVESGKILFSTLIEHYRIGRCGRFRGWMLVSLGGIGLALLVLLAINPLHSFPPLAAACLLLCACGTLYGCAVLGLSCVLLPYRERGFGGVIQTVAARAGKMIGGALVLLVFRRWGWQAAVGLVLLFNVLLLLQVWFYREPEADTPPAAGFGMLFVRMIGFWRLPGRGLRWLLLLAAAATPYAWIAATFVPKLGDLGFSPAQTGTILAVAIPLACMTVTPLAGYLARKQSRRRIVTTLCALQLPLVASFAWIDRAAALHHWLPPLQIVALSLSYTLLLPVMLALMMDKSEPATAALDSSLQFSVLLAGTYAAGFAGLRLAERWGYPASYSVAAGLALLVCAAFAFSGQLFEYTAQERNVVG